jgi:hypothetical protein
MKTAVTKFKSLAVALKELEPFIRNGQHLKTGKPFKKFGGMRSPELLANWLMCSTINRIFGEGRLEFTSDPTGTDGMIIDTTTDESWATEHVMALPDGKTAGDAIIRSWLREWKDSRCLRRGHWHVDPKNGCRRTANPAFV